MSAAPSGRRVLLARLAAGMVLVLYVAGIAVNRWLDRRIGPGGGNPVEDAIMIVGFGMFAVVGALLVARRPGNLIGWILSVTSLVVPASALETYAAYVMTTTGRPDPLAVFGAWVNGWYWFLFIMLAFIYLPLYFPDGRLPSRRWLPVAVISGAGALVIIVLGMFVDTLTGQDIDYRIENPIGIEGLAHVEDMPLVIGALGVPLAVGCVGAVAAVVVRVRRSGGVERQQMKWFLFATAPVLAFPFADFLPGIVGGLVLGWLLIGLPTAIGIAVLRYRLYDIDLVINRTLVYGTLTASLAAVYFGSVVGLQRLLSPLTGEGNQLAVVASTLLIAALFGPLRRRVQSFIDRRFYRKKYDAEKTLQAFSAVLRDETDLDRLAPELLEVVRETVQPERAFLWLRPSAGGRGAAEEARE
ncbi:hypothetical protein GBA63_15215 [Rubrobacter tropicus]|uniref:Uncharacterized protein n=1 Tax=Rubrobacter tropicus TaxID=2653851 RepID=A0A6G8QBG7_9ACTN|nr:hypothetical protein [Rubrobacter tropicus]QIN83835.1 hypothetical protein GBA63_15215 [Rubrobacter tropicus]